MIIEIASTGGFGGISAAGLNKRIDVEEQSDTVRQELCDAFGPEELGRLAAQPCETCPDRMTYHITVTDEDRNDHIFTLQEDQIPPEMLDLIDQM